MKIFVSAGLSKSQIDTMNKFIKVMLVFTSPKNKEIARKIHAGYLSCRREAMKQHEKRDIHINNCLTTCKYFSLAIDTALFGQEHVLSCTSRFVFDERMEQFTLFHSVCRASTGNELAQFVFDKLKQFKVPFEKLVSVASDGAKNMIGAVNGMIPNLKRLIKQEINVDHAPFKSVWCLAHRLNLVITDYMRVPYINSVFLFADWFTSKRKAVQDKKWLSQKYPNNHFKKIPKLSETRWSFYRDVLKALLTQMKQIGDFLKEDNEFPTSRQKMKPLFDSAVSSEPSSLSNPFIVAHFNLAQFLLDEICILNSMMQEEYATLPVLWEYVLQFKKRMSGYCGEIKTNCFSKIESICSLSESQKATILHVMEMTVLNLDIRFPCPSLSIETKIAKRNMNVITKTLEPEFLKRSSMMCPYLMEVNLFNFPDLFIKKREINPWFLRQFHEVDGVLKEIVQNEIAIKQKTTLTRQGALDKNQRVITLFEVFKVVDPRKYPVLWDVVLRVMSYTPTSVSCEQSFCILKRRMHENMKRECILICRNGKKNK